jgi:hypothetical protein
MRPIGPIVMLVLSVAALPAWAQRNGAMNEAGSLVAFSSADSNLVAGDTNNAVDVFVRDIEAGVTTRVSVANNGLAGSGDSSFGVDIDDSGRYVVFGSAAALSPNDTNTCIRNVPGQGDQLLPCPDVYLHDRVTAQTTRISVPAAGGQGNGVSASPGISTNGAWIVFVSKASNLVSGDTNGVEDAFLIERATGVLSLVSRSSSGSANGISFAASISGDGRYVTFLSDATNLTPEADPMPCSSDDTFFRCVRPFIFDRAANTITRVPVPAVVSDFSLPGDVFLSGLDISPDARLIGMSVDFRFGHGLEAPLGAVYDRVARRFVHTGVGSDSGSVIVRDGHFASGDFFIQGIPWGTAVAVDLRTGVRARSGDGGFVALDLGFGGRRLLIRGPGTRPSNATTALDATTHLLDLDGDGDGLESAWESLFGLDPLSPTDRLADPDGDGVTNADEYLAGSHPNAAYRYYLAEGATSAFFSTRLSLAVPGATGATFPVVRLLGENGLTLSTVWGMFHRLDIDYGLVPPPSDDGLRAANPIPDGAYSTIIESSVPLVVERTMTWGPNGTGSHAEHAVMPRTTWYFAEGATHGGFQLYYLLQNPSPQPVDVNVAFLRPAPMPQVLRTYTLAPLSRRTIWVDGVDPALAASDVAASLTATAPIVVERAMYRDVAAPAQMLGLGHAAAGADASPRWFLAEGATGTFFDLFYLIANPGDATTVRVTYLLDNGSPVVKTYPLWAQSRRTISVAQEDPRLANASISAILETTDGAAIVVERAMYWPAGGAWQEGHVAAGATATARRWATSGGRLRSADGTETFILIANTSASPGSAVITVPEILVSGAPLVRTVALAANSRLTLRMRDVVPAGITDTSFSVVVESDGPELVIERATYSNANGVVWAAGSALLATPLP